MAIQKALVIGGGIGGLCSAIALRQKGIEVDLIEKSEANYVWGIGIIHQTNAVRAEAMLGVADEVLKQGWGFSGGKIHNKAGHMIQEIAVPPAKEGAMPGDMGITRPRLAKILQNRAETLGTKITFSTTCKVTKNGPDGAEVSFSNGETAKYDLVVGADGIYSDLRDELWGKEFGPKFAGQGGWRCNIPRLPEVDQVWLFLTDKGNCGLMPLADDLMYIWTTSNEPDASWKEESQLPAEMHSIVSEVGGIYGEMRDKYLVEGAEVMYRPFEYVDLPRPWHKGSVVLIGDASHAATAHLAQGAAMAMEDAIVLAEEAGKAGNAPEALTAWEDRRYERCDWMAKTSLKICQHEQGLIDDPDFNLMGTMIEGRKKAMAPF